MKRIILFITMMAFLSGSCDKWIDPDINVDPNNPTDVSMAQLLAPVEVAAAYVVGGEMARWDCAWMQQITGLQSQAADADIYIINEADVTSAWSYSLYSPAMINAKIMMEKAEAGESPHYAGVARVLMAYLLGVTTDHWGDIPYSNAFKGAEGDCTAEYDTQEEIYATIFDLLDKAITDLNAPESLFSPGAEDLIYGGDLEKWEKTAYALKARYSLHLEKRKGSSALTDALNALTNAYTGNEDNMRVPFGSAYNNSNPMYQYESERTGYYSANTTFINLLDATGDPRKAVYFNGDEGSPSGEPNLDAASIGAGYASTDSPIDLVSYSEMKFIEAEARYKLNNTDPLAIEACNEGIKASLMREGAYGDGTWFNAHRINSSSISLETIMIHKYLSSFLQVETWTDWRRTGYPVFQLAKGAVLSQIPRRYPYCDEERLYNGENMPAGLTLTDRVWWDVAK
ncbi:MAG: SusD/RagB family nutrient-binding outer membrane lipoprotein [Bacteroidales bacterium]|nr:SusD/RagB family nutrient-binding outer membrane lipoprotein [Bacteroidales bacterium]